MLLDDLREQIKNIAPHIQTIITFWHNTQLNERLNELETLSHQEEFWKNLQQTTILKELQHIKTLHEQYTEIITTYQDFNELISLFAENETELTKISRDITTLYKKVIAFKVHLLLNEPSDSANCFVHIHAGAGGTESQDWANMLLRMYYRFCERNNFNVDTIDYQAGEEAGIKSATLFIRGKNALRIF